MATAILQRRERDERTVALRCNGPTVSAAHRRMADAYMACLTERSKLGEVLSVLERSGRPERAPAIVRREGTTIRAFVRPAVGPVEGLRPAARGCLPDAAPGPLAQWYQERCTPKGQSAADELRLEQGGRAR